MTAAAAGARLHLGTAHVLEEAPARPVKDPKTESEEADVPAADERSGPARPGLVQRVLRGLLRALFSPWTWLVSAAFAVYWTFTSNA